MTPETETQSKLNLLRANLQQYRESHLFTELEKALLTAPIQAQINQLTNQKEAPTECHS